MIPRQRGSMQSECRSGSKLRGKRARTRSTCCRSTAYRETRSETPDRPPVTGRCTERRHSRRNRGRRPARCRASTSTPRESPTICKRRVSRSHHWSRQPRVQDPAGRSARLAEHVAVVGFETCLEVFAFVRRLAIGRVPSSQCDQVTLEQSAEHVLDSLVMLRRRHQLHRPVEIGQSRAAMFPAHREQGFVALPVDAMQNDPVICRRHVVAEQDRCVRRFGNHRLHRSTVEQQARGQPTSLTSRGQLVHVRLKLGRDVRVSDEAVRRARCQRPLER